MRLHVLIATCNRQQKLQNLLSDVRNIGSEVISVTVAVDSDPSTLVSSREAPSDKIEVVFPSPYRLGKKGYARVQHALWQAAFKKAQEGDLFLCLSDDMRLCDMFIERVLDQWERIPLNKRHCLNLLVDSSRLWGPCWGKPAAQKNEKGPTFTQWMDGNFLCDMRFARHVASILPQVKYDPRHASSNVWKTVSTLNNGLGIWLVPRSLVVHTLGESKMHGDLRVSQPLHAVNFVDGGAAHARLITEERVIACLATVPERERGIQRVVDSLSRQVGTLFVYPNNFGRQPKLDLGQGVVLYTGKDEVDLGDAAKFKAFDFCFHGSTENKSFYYFTCDDDFIYSDNYVLHTLMGVERHQRRAVVGYHGAILNKDFKSYYMDRQKFHWANPLKKDTFVHVIGTGVMAFHSSTIQPRINDFKVKNMADVWFSKLCQDQKIPRVVLAHDRSLLDNIPYRENIYNHAEETDAQRTKILKETADWSLQVCK